MTVPPSERRERVRDEAADVDASKRKRRDRRRALAERIAQEDRMATPRAMVFGAVVGIALWAIIIAVLVRTAF